MELSLFGQRFTQKSGILELMEDLGTALGAPRDLAMLGGGNPASIPAVNQIWKDRLEEILRSDDELEVFLTQYDTPQGKLTFLQALSDFFKTRFGWNVGPENIAVTNGSQNAFFLLFNLFAGEFASGQKKSILFPLAPEYIGYADQSLGHDSFRSCRPKIEILSKPYFKYFVDFEHLSLGAQTGAICVSRPTNPTGNVLTKEEVDRLSELCQKSGIPLLLDNAYGTPFPGILFEDIEPFWNETTVLVLSLSKLGLPAARTGIVVARPEIVEAVTSANAILNLANSGMGQTLLLPLLKQGALYQISQTLIRPFYQNLRDFALNSIAQIFASRFPYHIHQPQGALFLWLWFPELPVSTRELYELLKARGVIIVPGEYFFFGMPAEDERWKHRQECVRLNYARPATELTKGLQRIAEVVEQCYR